MDDDFQKAAEFHGHTCPGLAMGYRVAKYVKEHYPRAKDEELVCIAENKSCSLDAIQSLLGCTAGKGNLILKDNGKQVFTVYSRDNNKALRIYFKGNVFKRMDELRQKMALGELGPEEKKEMEGLRSRGNRRHSQRQRRGSALCSGGRYSRAREGTHLSFPEMPGVRRVFHGDPGEDRRRKGALQGLLREDGVLRYLSRLHQLSH
jgi:hypothetical protein